MSQRPFSFLHAGDLHLDQPLEGLVEGPDWLIDLAVDCPLRAAARLFDAAIDHAVDFVVLSGHVIDWRRASPREVLALVEQFERLAERGIAVYWAAGEIDDPDQRPAHIALPGNVHVFPSGRSEHVRHQIAGTAVCEIVGRSHSSDRPPRPYDFAPSDAGLFAIAAAHVEWNCGALGEIGARYWALGGPHQRSTPLDSNCVAHYPGSPQGRRPAEAGVHGGTLVSVGAQGNIQLKPISCDVVRWHAPTASVSDDTDLALLSRTLSERTHALVADSGSAVALITWNIACEGSKLSIARRGELAAELLTNLRNEFASRDQSVWIADVRLLASGELPAAHYDEDSIRGEFLRAVRTCVIDDPHEANPYRPLVAADDVPAEFLKALGWQALSLDEEELRRRTLNEAAWLGSDLLGAGGATQ